MVRFTLFFSFWIIGIVASGQNIETDTVEWQAEVLTDLRTNKEQTHACTFVTYGLTKIKWVQQNGGLAIEWDVVNSNGNLKSLDEPGIKKYFFQDKAMVGELKVVKNPNNCFIELNLTGGSSDFKLKYSISAIKKI
jgi:hypothetical protein